MQIDVRMLGLSTSQALRHHIETRLAAALRPFASFVTRVTVRLADINANRGGIDKRCSLVAAAPRNGVVTVEALDADAYIALDRAADRLRTALTRQLTRHSSREQKRAAARRSR